jgi:hypothetical protein
MPTAFGYAEGNWPGPTHAYGDGATPTAVIGIAYVDGFFRLCRRLLAIGVATISYSVLCFFFANS